MTEDDRLNLLNEVVKAIRPLVIRDIGNAVGSRLMRTLEHEIMLTMPREYDIDKIPTQEELWPDA